MPDPTRLAISGLAAGAVAALVAQTAGRLASGRLAAILGLVGLAMGSVVGVRQLGVSPHWPPREDQDRFLLVLLPAAWFVELTAVICAGGGLRWIGGLLRPACSVAVAPILLWGSIYLTDSAGPGTREWTSLQTALILALLGVSAAIIGWLERLAVARWGRSIPAMQGAVCLAAGASVMLTGYASGGQVGAPLGGAFLGAAVGTWGVESSRLSLAASSLASVATAALLIVGRFFGETPTVYALAIFLCPLASWPAAAAVVGKFAGRKLRAALAGLVPVATAALVLVAARARFTQNAAAPSASSHESSVDDYSSYGK